MMNYSKLESLYDAFISHEKFPIIEEQAERVLQHPELDEKSKKIGNWSYNIMFLSNFFDRAKGSLFQTFEHFTVSVSDRDIVLNLSNAPNFKDRDAYLAWMHKELNK
ncbi:hypothetical protein [Acinetobacter entericus]|uniref:CdiI immunity protein domain-containing protein n=1 Tax=Acinetobacter entericus TaxID=2989714 RepID=A0ABT3NND3_9GAMM|nr:hypothetical protein [Acinetobacter entericus]MCW8041073.1 hypothetical protein [Acinetobacter entericus]